MPLTFPSHAAAVLPFCGRRTAWLPPSALVVGSCAPDLAYLFDTNRSNFHAWPNLLVPCLPLALAVWLWAELLVLPALRVAAPRWSPMLETRGVPSSMRGAVAVVAALAVGILTHLAWDGFTHAHRFPASVLYPEVAFRLGGYRVSLARLLQAACSLAGLLVVARAVQSRWRPHPDAPAPRLGLFALGVAAAVAVAELQLVSRWSPAVSRSVYGAPWLVFWAAARGAMHGVTLSSVLTLLVLNRPAAPRPGSSSAGRPAPERSRSSPRSR